MLILKNKSFTLIELLIYLASVSFFVFLVFNFFFNTQQKILFDIGRNEKLIKKTIASDLLRRDLMSASEQIADWLLSEEYIVFKKMSLYKKGGQLHFDRGPSCVGWQVSKNRIVRIEGAFDFLSHKWGKRITSTVGYDFGTFGFGLNKSKDGKFIKSVEFSFGDDDKQLVLLRNGEI